MANSIIPKLIEFLEKHKHLRAPVVAVPEHDINDMVKVDIGSLIKADDMSYITGFCFNEIIADNGERQPILIFYTKNVFTKIKENESKKDKVLQ